MISFRIAIFSCNKIKVHNYTIIGITNFQNKKEVFGRTTLNDLDVTDIPMDGIMKKVFHTLYE